MPKLHSYVTDLELSFGAAKTKGRLVGVKRADAKTKFTYCTPDGNPVHQVYKDDLGNEYTVGDLHKGVMEDDVLKYIGKEIVDEAKKSELPYNVVSMTPHTQESVERYLFPSNNQAYVFEVGFKDKTKWIGRDDPKMDPALVAAHDFIVAMLNNSGAVFLSLANIKNFEGMYRISLYQGHIVLHKQCFPDELNQFEESLTQIPPAALKKGLQLVTQRLTDFDPNNYKSPVAENLAKLAQGEYAPAEAPAKEDKADFDLMSMLEDESAWS